MNKPTSDVFSRTSSLLFANIHLFAHPFFVLQKKKKAHPFFTNLCHCGPTRSRLKQNMNQTKRGPCGTNCARTGQDHIYLAKPDSFLVLVVDWGLIHRTT